MHRLQELVRLHRLGTGARRIAKLLRISPNTERKYRLAIEQANLMKGPPNELPDLALLKEAIQEKHKANAPAQELSSILPWKERIEELVQAGLTARPVYDRMRQEHTDFEGSYWAVKRMCRALTKERGIQADQVAIPVQTKPGEVAQVDFGYVGKLLCPEDHVLKRAWVFIMVLGYSRHMFAKVVFDQKASTWIDLHILAFEHFSGVPKVIVPDNLKAAVIRAAFGLEQETGLNRSYRELARHYGFMVDPAPPYAPKKKGKVESAVKYTKNNALAGRQGQSINDINLALNHWVEQVAGKRHHGVTGKQPLELFLNEEQAQLRSLPRMRFEPVLWKQAKVHQDAHVVFDRRLYSVPWRWTQKTVWIQATQTSVMIFGDDIRIATHPRQGAGKRSTVDAHLPEHRQERRHRSRDYWEARAAQIGLQTEALIREVFESDEVLYQLRKSQAILTHLEGFPKERAEAASRRALYYGTYSYQGIKSILAKALDLEPLPAVLVPAESPKDKPRFARNLSELIARKLEVNDEPH